MTRSSTSAGDTVTSQPWWTTSSTWMEGSSTTSLSGQTPGTTQVGASLLVFNTPVKSSANQNADTFLFAHDLTKNDAQEFPPVSADLSKNASVPSVNGGILWADEVNKRLYLWGGEVGPETEPKAFLLYSYDILGDHWVSYGPPMGTGSILPTSYGSGVSVSWRGEAYYYGGWNSNKTTPAWSSDREPEASNAMIRYNMEKNQFASLSGPDKIPRAEGFMVHIPASDAGMLVYFGGIRQTTNGTIEPQELNEIFIYDIAGTRWYTQETSGEPPGNRRKFCGGAAWAEDRSSYNM